MTTGRSDTVAGCSCVLKQYRKVTSAPYAVRQTLVAVWRLRLTGSISNRIDCGLLGRSVWVVWRSEDCNLALSRSMRAWFNDESGAYSACLLFTNTTLNRGQSS